MAEGHAAKAAAALRAGGVLLAPTDTVYGLMALPGQDAAVEKIFRLKRRPTNMNLQLLFPVGQDFATVGARPPEAALALLARDDIRPSITFIMPLDAAAKPAWLSHREEVGVRVPADAGLQAMLAETGPIFATSANAHGQPPGRTIDAILPQLDGEPAYVWDGGALSDAASTVINFNADPIQVLRWGAVKDLSEFGLGHG